MWKNSGVGMEAVEEEVDTKVGYQDGNEGQESVKRKGARTCKSW